MWYASGVVDRGPAAYDDVAEAYGRTFDPDGTGLRDPVFTQLLGEVDGQAVLALACGQGQDARLLADLGADVVAVDISEQMLRRAHEHERAAPRGIRYVHGDARTLEAFADGSFDGVACHMALMDIPDLAPAIFSVARVLRRGGWFVFSIVHPCFRGHVENVADYLADSRYEKRVPWNALPAHAYHRPISAYVNTLAEAGLSTVRMVEQHHEASPEGDVPGLLYARCVREHL